MKEHISQKECLPVDTKKDWGILTPQKDEKSSKNTMSEGIESKSDEMPSKNRISVIAFRKQPTKKNSVKSQPDVEKVPTTNLEAEVEIKTENPNEIHVKVDTETKIEDEIEKVKLNHSGCLDSKNFLSTIDAPPGVPGVSKNHIFYFTNETVYLLR